MQSSESNSSFLPENDGEMNVQISENSSSSSDKEGDLNVVHLSKSNCSCFGVHTESHDSGCSSEEGMQILTDNYSSENDSCFPVDIQSIKSDFSSPVKKLETTGAQLSESIQSSSLSEKYALELDHMCLLNNGHSFIAEEYHNLLETHSSFTPVNLHESFTGSLEMDISSFPNEKCNLVDPLFPKISESSPNKKHNSPDALSPEGECSLPPENHYENYSPSPESDFSFEEEILTSESKCYPSHKTQKLSNNEFSDDVCSLSPCIKRRLISGGSIKSDSPSPTKSVSAQSSDNDCLPSHLDLGKELPLKILFKASNDCEKMLRQIIRTAYQFTRHSHRQKLSLEDLEKAFKIHKVDMGLDDSNSLVDKINRDPAEEGGESQPFTCTGEWLSGPKDASLNE